MTGIRISAVRDRPRTTADRLKPVEIERIRDSFIAGRQIKVVARELQCSTRTVTKYYGFFRAEGVEQGLR